MLYNVLRPLADQFILFNLFRYITFRAGGACMTALIVSFLLGPSVIRWLPPLNVSQAEVDEAISIFAGTLAELTG